MGHVYFNRKHDFDSLYAERCGFKKKDKKRSCICSIIGDYEDQTIIFQTITGDEVTATIEKFDPKTGCVYYTTTGLPNSILIIDCDDIMVLRVPRRP